MRYMDFPGVDRGIRRRVTVRRTTGETERPRTPRPSSSRSHSPPDSLPLGQFRGQNGDTHAHSNDVTLGGCRVQVPVVGFFDMNRRLGPRNHPESFGISSGEDPIENGVRARFDGSVQVRFW